MVTVLASGAVMPEGTALWESAPLGEPSVKRGQVLRANRADDGSSLSADLFFVDEGTEGAGRYIYRLNNRPTVIRAMTFDGQELWSRSFAGEAVIKDLAADARGGLLLVLKATYDTDGLPQRVQRIDGATGAVSWEYFAPDDGDLSEVAVHPDGTVFVSTEGYYYPDVTYLVGLDGETGAVRQWRLPNGSSPTGPVVRDDGSVVVLFNPADDEGRHLQLATLNTGSSAPAFSDLYLATPKRWLYPYQYPLIPHGDALLLARKEYGTDVIRISPDGVMGPPTTLVTPDVPVAQVEYAVAGSTGMALIKRQTGQYDRPYNVYKASFDPVTLALSGVVPFGTDPYLTPRFIGSDGGVYISGEMFGSNDTQVGSGLWARLGGTASLLEGPQVDLHPSFSYLSGSSYSTNRGSRPITVGVDFAPGIKAAWSYNGASPLSTEEWESLKNMALAAARTAFAGYAVDFSEVPPGNQYDREVHVKNTSDKGDGATFPVYKYSDVHFWTVNSTMAALPELGCGTVNIDVCAVQTGRPRSELITALGRGVGNTAAHELGHQAGLNFNSHTGGMDCYDSPSAVGQYAKFFGTLRWSNNAKEMMRRTLTLR
jgi:hypothetical protein